VITIVSSPGDVFVASYLPAESEGKDGASVERAGKAAKTPAFEHCERRPTDLK
jgi:hypothetical protein